MTEQREEALALDFKDASEKTPIVVTLDCAKPVKEGEGQYGKWRLWFGHVENTTAYEGRKPNIKTVANYTGKVLFFPSNGLNEQLIKLANGQTNVKVSIVKKPGINDQGKPFIFYEVTKVTEGAIPQSSLTPGETKLITDVKSFIEDGHTVTETLFMKSSQEPEYGKITEERAKELYKICLGDNK